MYSNRDLNNNRYCGLPSTSGTIYNTIYNRALLTTPLSVEIHRTRWFLSRWQKSHAG